MTDNTWIPEPTDASRPFFEGAREGRLRLQICGDCGSWAYPVTTLCQECGSRNIGWADASGRGVVYAHARLARPYHPRHTDRLPLVLAEVDLDEGIRMVTNVVDVDPAGLKVGDAVELTFETFADGGVLPVFKPATS